MKDKFILDAACGGRMFWFNKHHPNTIYIDNRRAEKGHLQTRENHEVMPDVVMDFRALEFADKTFKLVVFDPPHLKTLSQSAIMAKKYGVLNPDSWEEDLKKGFDECWRVLEDFGVLIFKWNEIEIPMSKILKIFDRVPLFGHPTAKSGKTKWSVFMKIPDSKTPPENPA